MQKKLQKVTLFLLGVSFFLQKHPSVQEMVLKHTS